jgi:ABC-type uncharacterized transport system permease subunit
MMGSGIGFLLTALRLGTPLSYAALGGYCSERSGTINIALEGMMLIASFTSASIAYHTHNPWLGILGGIAGALLLALLHGFLCIELQSDQIISGMAVNFLAAGIPPVLSKALYDMSGSTPGLVAHDRIPEWFGLSPIALLIPFMAFALWLIHRHGKLGQYLRFAGEHPAALQSQGISIRRVRWTGVLLAGVFCGIAGAYLSIDHGSGFARNMTAGRGYIALAALIIGRWTPLGAVAAAFVFGAVEATQILMQGASFGENQTVPVQWIQMLPYIATLVILAGVVGGRFGKARAPKALGTPLHS